MYNKNSLTTLVFVLGFTVAIVFGSSFLSPLVIAAVLMAGMYGIILVGRPAELLFMAMLFVLFKGTITALYLPFTQYYDNVFLAVFFALLVGWSLTGKYSKEVIPKERSIFIPALACVFISAVMGGGGLSAFKWLPYYYITYFAYLMFFLVGRQVLTDKHIPKIIHFFAGFMLVQYLMNLGYKVGVNPIPQPFVRLKHVDYATGTMRTGLHVAYYCLFAGFLLLSLIDNKALGSGKKKVLWAVFIFLIFLSFLLTNTTHAVPLFAICISFFTVFVARRKGLKLLFIMAVVGIIFLGGSFQSIQFESVDSGLGAMQKNLSWSSLEDRWKYSIRYGPKMQVYEKAFVDGLSTPRTYLFGVGGARGISGKARRADNPVAMYYLGDIYLTDTGSSSLKGGSIMASPVSALNELMVELGIVGVFCYYLPYVYLLFRISMFYRKGRYSRNQAILAGALIPFIILTLIISTLTVVFSVAFYYATIWVLASLVWDPVKTESGAVSAQEDSG